MNQFHPYLIWLDEQAPTMADLVRAWASVNSGSRNRVGLDLMLEILRREFALLGGSVRVIPLGEQELTSPEGNSVRLPLGSALSVTRREEAPLRVLLNIHYDTVYPSDHAFRECTRLDRNTLQGPGVADAKGGLVVMYKALEAIERSPWADRIGWEVLLNPDEEIGSPGSTHLLEEAARRNRIGLVFEPAWLDGQIVGTRKGSSVYSAVVRGRAAHAGRSPNEGRNAINALAEFVVRLNTAAGSLPGVILNVGSITGGGPANVVPDLAYCRFNVRVDNPEAEHMVYTLTEELIDGINRLDGLSAELHRNSRRPPKVLDALTRSLMDQLALCGRDVGIDLTWRPSGGAGDGSVLAAAGLPTLDGLGPRGGALHSPHEFVHLDSFAERAKLIALFLMKLAAGEIAWP